MLSVQASQRALPLIGNDLPRLGVRRHRYIEKQRIIMLINMIHQAQR